MNVDQFDSIVQRRIAKIAEVLQSKAGEYASVVRYLTPAS